MLRKRRAEIHKQNDCFTSQSQQATGSTAKKGLLSRLRTWRATHSQEKSQNIFARVCDSPVGLIFVSTILLSGKPVGGRYDRNVLVMVFFAKFVGTNLHCSFSAGVAVCLSGAAESCILFAHITVFADNFDFAARW